MAEVTVPLLTGRTTVLELCRQPPERLNAGRMMELQRQLGGLIDWWLCPEALAQLKQRPGWQGGSPRPPAGVGACWVVFAQRRPRPFPALRDAFALPLEWRRGIGDSPHLPGKLAFLARSVARSLYHPEWGLHLSSEAGLGTVDLSGADDEFEDVGSCWAALAGGLLLAVKGGRPNPEVWATGRWDPDHGMGKVGRLRDKILLACAHGATAFFLPESQMAEARDTDLEGQALKLEALQTGTLEPQRVLGNYLHRLDAEPAPPADPDDDEGFNRCVAYYLRQPRGREDTRRFYWDSLLPTIIERCRRQAQQDWPGWSPSYLITVVSGSPELVPLTARALGVRHCLLLYTPDEDPQKDQTKAMLAVKEGLEGEGVECVEGAFTDGEAMSEQIPAAVKGFRGSVPAGELVLDITPGNKWMTWIADHAMPPGSWRVYVRNDTLSPADRRPKPGSERLVRLPLRAGKAGSG